LDDATTLQHEVALKGFLTYVMIVGKVVHWTNYLHQTMSGYLNMLVIANNVRCSAECSIEPKPSTYHSAPPNELTTGFERHKSLPTRLPEKVFQINKDARLLLSRIGAQKCSNIKHIALSPGMLNVLKEAMKEMEHGNDDHPFFVAYSPLDVKETGVSFNRGKCLEVTTMLVSSKQEDDAYRRDKIRGYNGRHTLRGGRSPSLS
jgi:hypothetical protein